METEAIDKLFLELSQFTTATTKKELELLVLIDRLGKVILTVDGLKFSSRSIEDMVLALVNDRDRWKQNYLDVLEKLQRLQDSLDRSNTRLATASNERDDARGFLEISEARRADLLKMLKELLTVALLPNDVSGHGVTQRARDLVRQEEGG